MSAHIDMHHRIEGEAMDGIPLVAIHDWEQSLGSLQPLAEQLAEQRAVHLVDLPGFGGTPAPDRPWECADFARCVRGYLDKKGLEQVDLLGHGFGGRIASYIAVHWPDRLRRLILMGATGLPLAPLPAGSLWDRTRRLLALGGAVQATKEGAQATSKVEQPDLSRITAPTLLLWGSRDPVSRPAMAKRVAQQISNSKLIILSGGDHFLCQRQQLARCSRHIAPFLGE